MYISAQAKNASINCKIVMTGFSVGNCMREDGRLCCFTCNVEGHKRLSLIFLVTAAIILIIDTIIGAVQLGIEGK